LLGLGLPWLIKSLVIDDVVKVDECGIFRPVAILMGTLIAFFSILLLNKWDFDSRAGRIFLLMYVLYFGYSLLVGVGTIQDYAC